MTSQITLNDQKKLKKFQKIDAPILKFKEKWPTVLAI